MATISKTVVASTKRGLSSDDMREIAMDACIYAYPLVMLEMTRRATTNVETANAVGQAPMNQFSHIATFPDPTFTTVVRPNADTLYSILFFDVSREPLVINVPDSGGRYFLIQFIDAWTDVFASLGARTTGTGGQRFALVGPGWSGATPTGSGIIRSPTAIGVIVSRAQTNGTSDYEKVHEFQHGLTAIPLSQSGSAYTPAKGTVNPAWDAHLPPVEQVDHMNAEMFLTVFAHASRGNPPHANDYPVLYRMRRIGLEPGKSVSFGEMSIEVRRAIDEAWPGAAERIKGIGARSGIEMNGWRINLTAIGTYGTDYLHRAGVAHFAFGANTVDDAVYPSAFADADGQPLSSDGRYVIHFEKDQLPPVRAFWSVTMYDARQLFAQNPISRYAIGDRDDLRFNADGSLDIYIQRSSPGPDKQSNWLPTPASGAFSMTMRLYWPKIAVTDGAWAPPLIKRTA
jgi:hypothetical protein